MGMVGGGKDAFIGAVHRMAAFLDGEIQLVCGAFSSNAEKSKASGEALYLPENRVYGTYEEMIIEEAKLPVGERMDFVAIVTPNHMHYGPAKAALEAGFSVICDKPLSFTIAEAEELVQLVKDTELVFALTHNYTGYPMVKQARDMVRSGAYGKVRKVVVEYPQGWLATPLEAGGQKQADWRTDPKRAGISCCMGDIGTHAENLAEYVTGLKIESLCADLSTFVDGRLLDDDGQVLLRLEDGAKGVLFASQIAAGEENNLKLRVYCEKAGFEWAQQEPNTLWVKHLDRPTEMYRAGGNQSYLSPTALFNSRLPAGHPEGYLEAFANIYKNFATAVRHKLGGGMPTENPHNFPTVEDGLRGMRFIEAVVKSSEAGAVWVSL